MPAAPARKTPAKRAPARRLPPAAKATRAAPTSRRVAVPADGDPQMAPRKRFEEPVWLVRAVLVLFLVGFAAFLARELRNFLSVLP